HVLSLLSLLAVTTLDNLLVGAVVLLAGLVTHSRLAPRGNRRGTADRALAFAAAVRVIAGVHDRTTDGRADTHMTGTAGLTVLHVGVGLVADLAYGGLAVQADVTNFAGRQTNLRSSLRPPGLQGHHRT